MANKVVIGLGRDSSQCIYCETDKRNTIVCYCHKEEVNVLHTYIRNYNILVSGDQWTLRQLCHRRVYCPKELQCMQVRKNK